jgi:hypothetical protein
MSDVQILIGLCVAALLVLAVSFSSLKRIRRTSVDYWLPDGRRLKRKAGKPS